MPSLLLILLAALATAVAAALLRRRRPRRSELAPRIDLLPAGVHLLASSVSDRSDLGLHVDFVRRARAPRAGAVLVQR